LNSNDFGSRTLPPALNQEDQSNGRLSLDQPRSISYPASPLAWYLIRTKPGKERYAQDRLARVLPEVFLPMLKMRSRRSPAAVLSTVPLFPQYIFAQLDLTAHFFQVRYMPGIVGFVSTGHEALAIPQGIVDSVRSRCTDGVVELSPHLFRQGEQVRVVEGPFRDFEAIFENYLSGSRRVALLIKTLEGSGLRLVADASIVASQTCAFY
jgi:transcriptional antiterminator RfaH